MSKYFDSFDIKDIHCFLIMFSCWNCPHIECAYVHVYVYVYENVYVYAYAYAYVYVYMCVLLVETFKPESHAENINAAN